jgi:hypothetical protein
MDTNVLFESLDKEFINLDRVVDDVFVYNGADVLVQSTWELPIIIQWPGSTINFEFSTTQGAIEFGIVFVPALEDNQQQDELEVETIEEMGRIRSDLETIAGSFQPPSEGVIFFLWDNTYDWSAVKKLTYTVECLQPSFTLPDYDRCNDARAVLDDVLEDQDTARTLLDDAQYQIDLHTPIVDNLESELNSLKTMYREMLEDVKTTDEDEDRLILLVNGNNENIPGLCIRMLNKHLVSVIIGYLDLKKGNVYIYMCTYIHIYI